MRIDFFCAAYCHDEGEPTQLSGCGIVLKFADGHDRVSTRELGFALGASDKFLADIQALRLALSSVRPGHRDYECVAYILSDDVVDVLSGKSCEHPTAASELRKWFGFYSNLRVISDDHDHESIKRALVLAEAATKNQEHSDSGSMHEADEY